jgi:hypothetical protein
MCEKCIHVGSELEKRWVLLVCMRLCGLLVVVSRTSIMSSRSMSSSVGACVQYTRSSNVCLKVVLFTLFLFLNRAQRVLRNESIISENIDLRGTAIMPLCASAMLHVALMSPGLFIPTRHGRVSVLCSVLHVALLYSVALFLVTAALWRYTTTASFLSVLLASHLCLVVRPTRPDLVPAQKLTYGYFMDSCAYALVLFSWVLLPILRVSELEAIALLYVPEALCFVFAYTMQLVTLLLNVMVAAAFSVGGGGGGGNGGGGDLKEAG